MYDFCLTIPYGVVLALGGLMGLMHGSLTSALVGGGVGGTLVAIGYVSYSEFAENTTKDGKMFRSPTYAYVQVSLVLAMFMTFLMGSRWMEAEGEATAPKYVTIMSAVMVLFYVYKLYFSGDVGSSAKRAYGRND